jgi:hypothetical protein
MKKLEDDPNLDTLIKACASSKRGGKKESLSMDYQVTFWSSLTKLFNYSPSFDGRANFKCPVTTKEFDRLFFE